MHSIKVTDHEQLKVGEIFIYKDKNYSPDNCIGLILSKNELSRYVTFLMLKKNNSADSTGEIYKYLYDGYLKCFNIIESSNV